MKGTHRSFCKKKMLLKLHSSAAVYYWIFFQTMTVTCNSQLKQLLPKLARLGGQNCTYLAGGRNLYGTCRFPLLCSTSMGDLAVTKKSQQCPADKNLACCPTESRISERKCREYENYISVAVLPMVPVESLDDIDLLNQMPRCRDNFYTAIVNGEDALDGEFPHMVALGFGNDSTKDWNCGGTLISEDFVLTAAHCIESPWSGKVQRVLLGALKLSQFTDNSTETHSPNLQVVNVEQTFKHPNFSASKSYNDIALLKLQQKIELNPNVRPACLPQPRLRLDKIKDVRVTGWGRNMSDPDSDVQSDTLQKVKLRVYPSKNCSKIYTGSNVNEGIKSSQICAGDIENGKDSCKGDSGGPMTVTIGDMTCVFYVTGIVSFGGLCGRTPGVYTNVQYYLDWIESIVWPVAEDKIVSSSGPKSEDSWVDEILDDKI